MIASPSRSFEESTVNVEDLLTELQPCPGIGIAILDDQLRFKAVNPALAYINGVPAIQHLGKTIADVLGRCSCQARIETDYPSIEAL